MNDLLSFLNSIGHPRILILGDIILDRYTWGDAERVSPEAPVLVLKADTHEVRLGGAASVAGLLRGLEAEVTLAGVIGADANGRVVRRLLEEAGIDARLVLCDEDRPTTTKQRLIGRADGKHPHHILRVDEENDHPVREDLRQTLIAGVVGRLDEFDAVLISDYAKGVCRGGPSKRGSHAHSSVPESDAAEAGFETVPTGLSALLREADRQFLQSIIRAATERGVPVLVDPARVAGYDCYRGATLLKPNRVEAELAVEFPLRTPEAAMRAGEALCEQLELLAAVVTLDRDGMVLSRRGAASDYFRTRERPGYDITGAGDTALAMLGLILADAHRESKQLGRSVESRSEFRVPSSTFANAVGLANIASGLQVERLGVTSIRRDQIRTELLTSPGGNVSRVTTLENLAAIARRYQRCGKTIAFTNGCFDLLHAGHLACLQQASRHGDVLMVAINSDDSVQRMKGPGRPVIHDADRAALVAALACVDHVVIFGEDTPHRVLEVLRPDVLVKGGTTGSIVGREVVEAYGGKVAWTETVPGLSTTELVHRLEDGHSCPSSLRLQETENRKTS